MSSGDEFDAEPMYTETLEDIFDGIQSYPNINSTEACYKIRDRIKKIRTEWKGLLLSTRNMGKGLHKLFKAVVNDILQFFQFWVNLDHRFLISFQNIENLHKLTDYKKTSRKLG